MIMPSVSRVPRCTRVVATTVTLVFFLLYKNLNSFNRDGMAILQDLRNSINAYRNSTHQVHQDSAIAITAPSLTRILHVVTSSLLSKQGSDRFHETLLPTLVGTVSSLVNTGRYAVDVQLILGYHIDAPHRSEVANALRAIDPNIKLYIWDDAIPADDKKVYSTALARQHRYVVKANLRQQNNYTNSSGTTEAGTLVHFSVDNVRSYDYDLFSCWEDDMFITARHVDHFRSLSRKFEKLAFSGGANLTSDPTHGSLSKEKLLRMIPGFIRAEVILGTNDTILDRSSNRLSMDCCNATKQNLMIWETRPEGIRVRNISEIGTVGLLPVTGPHHHARVDGARVGQTPNSDDPQLFAQQAGWMATADQVRRFDSYCSNHGFLPPFKVNELAQTVEYWSGGFQLFGARSGCAMQRVMLLDDDQSWSDGLIWHLSNNKQNVIKKQRHWDATKMRKEIMDRWTKGATDGATHLISKRKRRRFRRRAIRR